MLIPGEIYSVVKEDAKRTRIFKFDSENCTIELINIEGIILKLCTYFIKLLYNVYYGIGEDDDLGRLLMTSRIRRAELCWRFW